MVSFVVYFFVHFFLTLTLYWGNLYLAKDKEDARFGWKTCGRLVIFNLLVHVEYFLNLLSTMIGYK